MQSDRVQLRQSRWRPALCEAALETPELDHDALCHLYTMDHVHGLTSNGDYQTNWGGQDEKWLRDGVGASVYLLPNGQLYDGTDIHAFAG